jgi:hypothetical protein
MESNALSAGLERRSAPSYQAFRALQLGFVVAPIVAGLDKFTNLLVDWEIYLAPVVGDVIDPGTFMMIVGVIEIVAGIGVALRPRIFGLVVAGWLVAIIVNLLMIPGFYDVALRDLGLAIGAFALSRLAEVHGAGKRG